MADYDLSSEFSDTSDNRASGSPKHRHHHKHRDLSQSSEKSTSDSHDKYTDTSSTVSESVNSSSNYSVPEIYPSSVSDGSRPDYHDEEREMCYLEGPPGPQG